MGIIRLRAELQALRAEIEELRKAIREHVHAIHAQQETERYKESPLNPKHVIVSYHDETVRDSQKENERQYRTQNSIRKAAWAAFGAAVIYAGIATFQWWVMHGQLEEMKREQEAYIAPESLTAQNFPDGETPTALLTFRNYGKDTATQVFGNATMSVSNTPIDWSIGFLPILGNPAPDPKGNFALPPIAGNANRIRWVSLGGNWSQHRDAVKAGTEYFYIWGFIAYSTVDGKRLPSQNFCFVYSPLPERPRSMPGPFDICEVR